MTTNYLKAVVEFEEFEKTHIVLWGNIAEILNKNQCTTKEEIKLFCDTCNLYNTKLRNYLYKFNYKQFD